MEAERVQKGIAKMRERAHEILLLKARNEAAARARSEVCFLTFPVFIRLKSFVCVPLSGSTDRS